MLADARALMPACGRKPPCTPYPPRCDWLAFGSASLVPLPQAGGESLAPPPACGRGLGGWASSTSQPRHHLRQIPRRADARRRVTPRWHRIHRAMPGQPRRERGVVLGRDRKGLSIRRAGCHPPPGCASRLSAVPTKAGRCSLRITSCCGSAAPAGHRAGPRW